ncbi:MAG: AAC(3) family N-acetyltransferase [Lachnospiraceae bacterium]|nr:AAC(3) family N-acetyltransferase [Lachnospiraceae bacterium]
MTEMSFSHWLEQLGWIQKGDCLYVVSDMMELAKHEKCFGRRLVMDEVIDKLQELVGEQGTLLFPTFNWDFCKGVAFDYYKTPSRTGALSKAALKRADFQRTAHPIYSFAVWGKFRDELMADKSVDSFGKGTIFEKMFDWDAKVLDIGVTPLQGVTYVHHVEQMVGVPYRYDKAFTADYTDATGVCEKRTYRMYVRDLVKDPQYVKDFLPLAEKLQKEGIILSEEYDNVDCHTMKIRELDGPVREEILENDSRNLYRYHGQKEAE